MNLLVALLVLAQDPVQEMAARTYDGPGGKLLYRMYTPKGASADAKLPLILFLHGAGERGDDNAAQLKNCMKQFLKMQEKYPAFIVAPQCPKGKKWNEVDWQAASHVTPAIVRVLELPRHAVAAVVHDHDLDRQLVPARCLELVNEAADVSILAGQGRAIEEPHEVTLALGLRF